MPYRAYPRVRLRLPVRLRWVAPLGQKTEKCETRNASRGGLLLACQEHHGVGMPLWVTFPYDPTLDDNQPEVLARVIRCEDETEGASVVTTVAVHFEGPLRSAPGPGSNSSKSPETPSPLRTLAVPIRVRPERIPWFEEAMTVDVSSETLRFITNRVYSPGMMLHISFVNPGTSPWAGDGERNARIVQIEHVRETNSLAVTVQRIPS